MGNQTRNIFTCHIYGLNRLPISGQSLRIAAGSPAANFWQGPTMIAAGLAAGSARASAEQPQAVENQKPT